MGVEDLIEARFGTRLDLDGVAGAEALEGILGRGSCRHFTEGPVSDAVLDLVAAAALSAPSKSDLQQRDVLVLTDPAKQTAVKSLLSAQAWITDAPALLIFLGNNRRQRQMHAAWGRDFANDHFDALFNASVDAGIALATGLIAAEALGLGACPISTIRDAPRELQTVLGLPDHVFPVAGLALGWPKFPAPRISPRVSLAATVHRDAYDLAQDASWQPEYDARRGALSAAPRAPEAFGTPAGYLWSDDKTRQYARPERADWGAYLREIGFRLG